jgi:hypothetical protein
MNGLYFLYVFALQCMAALRAQDVRIVPFALMAWIIQPVVNSLITLSFFRDNLRQPIDVEYPNFYTRVDVWFYVSLAVALAFSWIVFDRRRDSLQKRFRNFQERRFSRYRFMILLSQLAFAVLLSYLSHISSWYCLLAFVIGMGLSFLAASTQEA